MPDYDATLTAAMALSDSQKLNLIDELTNSITAAEIDRNALHDAARRIRIALAATSTAK